ncbi:MAG TPA: fatty acid desaturase [Polyangiaceae bacterium]
MRSPGLRHLLSLFPPSLAVLFVATGPHRWWVALAMLPAPFVLVAVDRLSGTSEGESSEEASGWPFDLLLVAHAIIHFALVAGYLRLAGREGILSADFWVGALLVGHNTGWSAIIVGHELVHRRSRGLQLLGRALLCTALYEHFATEHVRGHHVRVGTGDDPATARFGETLSAFKRRTIPAQFRSAWRIECRRLGDANMGFWDRRVLRSRVVHGLAAELLLAVAAAVCFGPAAVAALALQAWEAINLLETVNYFEHWGLSRADRRVDLHDSWDTESAFTRYALIGLARHADHHAHPSRPFHALRGVHESPKLPYGYPPMVLLANAWNSRFQRLMTDELRRRGLGPFAIASPAAAE